MRRRRMVRTLVAGFVAAALAACSGGGGPPPGAQANSAGSTPSPSPAPTAGPTHTPKPRKSPRPTAGAGGYVFVYLDGATLTILELDDGHQSTVTKVPSLDFYADPAGGPMAFVTGAGASDDFAGRPVLNLFDAESRSGDPVGPGFAPFWGPGGRLAYLEPVGARDCSGETCSGERRLITLDTYSGRSKQLLGAGPWGILAWAGDYVIVSDGDDLSHVLSVSASDGTAKELSYRPSEIWDASPDGKWLVRAGGAGAAFVGLARGLPSGSAAAIPLGKGVLADGSWAPDSSGITAVLLEGGSSRLVSIATGDPRPETIPGSKGAAGPVLYSPDSKSFLFTRELPSGRLAAVHCLVAGFVCKDVLTWKDEVVPLRVELAP